MNPATVLEQLGWLGASVQLDGADLVLTPGSKVAPELLAAVRECKPQIIKALSDRMPPQTGLAPLLKRLRPGQAWLTANLDHHMATESVGDPVFLASLEAWVVL